MRSYQPLFIIRKVRRYIGSLKNENGYNEFSFQSHGTLNKANGNKASQFSNHNKSARMCYSTQIIALTSCYSICQ